MTFPPSLSIVAGENLSARAPHPPTPISRDIPQELLETNIISEVMLESKKKRKEKRKMAVGVAKAMLSFQTVSTFSFSEGGKKEKKKKPRHFSNPPTATVPRCSYE